MAYPAQGGGTPGDTMGVSTTPLGLGVAAAANTGYKGVEIVYFHALEEEAFSNKNKSHASPAPPPDYLHVEQGRQWLCVSRGSRGGGSHGGTGV